MLGKLVTLGVLGTLLPARIISKRVKKIIHVYVRKLFSFWNNKKKPNQPKDQNEPQAILQVISMVGKSAYWKATIKEFKFKEFISILTKVFIVQKYSMIIWHMNIYSH